MFKNANGSNDHEILELHVVEKYKDEYGKRQYRGFVCSAKHGVNQIDTALIPKASMLETLAIKALAKVHKKQDVIESQKPLQIESPDDWS